MVRKTATAPVTAKMYRHFAVVTLVGTLGMAMFANGESREAVAREVEQAGQPSRSNPNDFVRKDTRQHGSFGTDEWAGGGLGAPTVHVGSVSSAGITALQAPPPQAGLPVGYTAYGITAEAWAALSDEQKKKIIAEREAARAAAEKPQRAQEIEALIAASRARSGNPLDVND